MPAHTYRVSVINPVQGVFNPAIVDFTLLDSTATDAEKTAGVCAYIVALSNASVIGGGCQITGVTKTAAGGGPGLPMPWPTTEYNTLDAANGATLQTLTGYSQILLGGTAFEALGVSVTCSLYTALPGRPRTGRHYIPWIADDVNDGNGKLVSTAPAQIEGFYRAFLMGETGSYATGVVDLQPVVHSATAGDNLVVTPIVSLNFARLKTRTR